MTRCTVGELARTARVSSDTVRLYEKMGLLPKAERGENRYRYFSSDSLPRLHIIRRLQEMGFTLEEIALFLELPHEDHLLCPDVRKLLEQKLAHLKNRIREMSSLASMLEGFIEQCFHQAEGTHCPLLEQFQMAFEGGAERKTRRDHQ